MTPDKRSAKRLTITFAFLLAAMACYVVGYAPGFGLSFLLGACLETVFWIRLLNRRFKSQQRLRDMKAGKNTGTVTG